MKYNTALLYTLVATLSFIWPLDHLMAIRNLSTLLLLLLSWHYSTKYNLKQVFNQDFKYLKISLYIIILLVIYATIVSIFSPFRNYCLREIDQLYKSALFILIAYFLIFSPLEYKKIFYILFYTLMFYPIYHVLSALYYFLEHKSIPFRSFGITANLDSLNFLMPFLLSFFAVQLIFLIKFKRRFLKINNLTFILLFFIALISLVIQDKRNGIISIIFLIVSVSIFIFPYKTTGVKKSILYISIPIFTILLLIFIDFKIDKRWHKFNKTFKTVFIENNMDDLYNKTPKNVDESAYQRMFFIREGLKLIKDNPLGYGYGRGIYGKALSKKYHVTRQTHAHSGMIDWGIGMGIIGLLLWSTIIAILFFIGIKSYVKLENYYGLLLSYLTISFYFRNFLDSLTRDHMLQQFIFFVSLSLFALYRKEYEKNSLS